MTTLVSAGLPVGVILPFAGPIANIPAGFLLCDGSEINRNDFADLFAAIGDEWGLGDNVTTFNIPTTQGLLLRGHANGSGYDLNRANRIGLFGKPNGDRVGTLQNDTVRPHQHWSQLNAKYPSRANNNIIQNGYGGVAYGNGAVYCNTGTIVLDLVNSSSGVRAFNGNFNYNDTSPNSSEEYATGKIRVYTNNGQGLSETVGKNVAVNYIIKF